MNEETKTTTPATETAPDAKQEEKKQEEKSFTQAELDRIVQERLQREAKNAPPKEELEAYRLWKENQKTEAEKINGELNKANKERDDAVALAASLERKVAALGKGIPADKVDKYAKLAEAYSGENVPFEKALEEALKDFPVSEEKKAVPGLGGNPPPPGVTKQGRPQGTVIF